MTTPNFASGTVWAGVNLPVMRGVYSATVLAVVRARTFGYDVEFHPRPGGVIGMRPDAG